MDDFLQWLVFHIYVAVLVAERNLVILGYHLVILFKSQTKRLLAAEDIFVTHPRGDNQMIFHFW